MENDKKVYLMTGGAGFIGINAADYFLAKGAKVIIFDNFSRKGTEENVVWLKDKYGEDNIEIIKGDIRTDFDMLVAAVEKSDYVLHFAAQVAVTTSVVNPKEDFDINALGTINVLEAVRKSSNKPPLIYSSTNKVYGGMEDLGIVEKDGRYAYENLEYGVSEDRGLDFHSPYGCSKGSADQYVRDYARIYGLKTIVFRQSCIYGTRQFGVEDQGWVAWFTIAAHLGKDLTIFGDGKQVRDVLYVMDLIEAYDMAFQNLSVTSGKIYNMGGGHMNQLSLLELLDLLGEELGKKIEVAYSDWRPGDQKVCVMDIRKAKDDFDWTPKTSVKQGVKILSDWVKENKELFSGF